MPNGHGGYREPSKPAPASGPGRYAKRTDGGPVQKLRKMTGGSYGEGQEMADIQRGAAMGGTRPASAAAQAAPAPVDPSALTPLDAPTGEPDVGLLDNLGQFQAPPPAIDDETRQRMQAYLPTLMWLASPPGASQQTPQFVRQIRADL